MLDRPTFIVWPGLYAIKYSKNPDNNLQFSKLALNDSYIIGVYPLQFVYLIYEF